MVAFSCTKMPQALTLMFLGSAVVIDASAENILQNGSNGSNQKTPVQILKLKSKIEGVPTDVPTNYANGVDLDDASSFVSPNDLSSVAASEALIQGDRSDSPMTKFQTASLLTGITLTTGGTMWAFERLAEAFKSENVTDPINWEYTGLLMFILAVGPALITYVMFNKFVPGSDKLLLWAATIGTGVAGVTFALGFHFVSGGGPGGFYFWIATALILILVGGTLFVKQNADARGGFEKFTAYVGHALGFAALVGGSGMFTYTFSEELRDVDPDNMGGEAALIWFAWMIGFAWLIKTFLIRENDYKNKSQTLFVLITAGVTAGFLIGGFECILNEASHSVGADAIVCFAGVAVCILFVILCKFTKLFKCKDNWLGKQFN